MVCVAAADRRACRPPAPDFVGLEPNQSAVHLDVVGRHHVHAVGSLAAETQRTHAVDCARRGGAGRGLLGGIYVLVWVLLDRRVAATIRLAQPQPVDHRIRTGARSAAPFGHLPGEPQLDLARSGPLQQRGDRGLAAHRRAAAGHAPKPGARRGRGLAPQQPGPAELRAERRAVILRLARHAERASERVLCGRRFERGRVVGRRRHVCCRDATGPALCAVLTPATAQVTLAVAKSPKKDSSADFG